METKLARISQLSKENPDIPGKTPDICQYIRRIM